MAKTSTNKVAHQEKTSALQFIRTIYLSLAAVIGLVVFVIGTVGVIRTGLVNGVFNIDDTYYYSPNEVSICDQPKSYQKDPTSTPIYRTEEEVVTCKKELEENRIKQKDINFKRDISGSISLTVVGFPIWLFHWMVMQADWKRRKQKN